MGKKHRSDVDTVVYDKTKAGRSKVVAMADGSGRNVMFIVKLIEDLKKEVDERFSQQSQYDDFPSVKGFFDEVSNFLKSLADADEKSSREKLLQFLGQAISMARAEVEKDEQIQILDMQLESRATEHIQRQSREAVTSEAEKFFENLTEHLKMYYDEFVRLIEEYKEMSDDVEERQNEIEQRIDAVKEEVEVMIRETGSSDLRSALFYARSRLVAFSKKVLKWQEDGVPNNERKSLHDEFEAVKVDQRWIVSVTETIKEVISDVSEHRQYIDDLKDEKAADIKRQIGDVKVEIRSKLTTFKDVGLESLFWGCVYGLHEVMDFVPVDLMVYRVEDPGLDSLVGDLQKYLDKYDSCNLSFDKLVEENYGKENVKMVEEEETDDDIVEKINVRVSEDREQQLKDLFIAVLWGFVRAQLEKNPKDARRGDYGRMARVVAKLLYQVEVITFKEKGMIRNEIAELVKQSEYVRIGKRKNPKTNDVQEYFHLTDSGRKFGKKLEDQYLLIMKTVVANRQAEREKYQQKVCGRKK